MRDKEITILLDKAEELKALFILGQRVVPFLEEIFLFIRDISPILDDINSSIEDNLQKVPKAAQQLSQVTEATELATNEIMDILDGFVYKADVISTNMREVGAKRSTQKEQDLLQNSENLLESLRMDASQIMMALQVQDITSQQLAAVNHLLQTVQGKLAKILKHFRTTEFSDLIPETRGKQTLDNVVRMHRDIAFDSDAIDALNHEGSRQDNVESVMQSFHDGTLKPDEQQDSGTAEADAAAETIDSGTAESANGDGQDAPASQGDIDALFAGGADADKEAPADGQAAASQDDIDAMFKGGADSSDKAEDSGESATSQADIDALFAGGAAGPSATQEDSSASQQDIDALFAKESDAKSDAGDSASQADIDALFNAKAGGETDKASQDDIDALFQKKAGEAEPPEKKDTKAETDEQDPTAQFSQDDIDALFNKK